MKCFVGGFIILSELDLLESSAMVISGSSVLGRKRVGRGFINCVFCDEEIAWGTFIDSGKFEGGSEIRGKLFGEQSSG